MPWSEILNHRSALERFQKSVANNRLASTYLFVGKDGVGKHLFALKLAQALLCENSPEPLTPCGSCPSCAQVNAQTHPDLILVSKPADKAFIPLELFIGKPEHRRQTGLCHEIGLKPFRGGRKIAIINDADFLNVEGANSLLKTLEEPPANSLLILIGSSEQKQISTIVSRSQTVRFGDLTEEEVTSILGSMIDLETTTPLPHLAAASGGSVARAVELANDETFQFRQSFLSAMASIDPGKDAFAGEVLGFVDAAGKDTAKKRDRLVMVGDFAIEFLRGLIATALGTNNDQPEAMTNHLNSAIKLMQTRKGMSGQQIAEAAGYSIERTIQLQADVRTNATPANIIAPWFRDVARALHGEPLVAT